MAIRELSEYRKTEPSDTDLGKCVKKLKEKYKLEQFDASTTPESVINDLYAVDDIYIKVHIIPWLMSQFPQAFVGYDYTPEKGLGKVK